MADAFRQVNGAGDPWKRSTLIEASGDQVTCDCLTGDSNTTAEITLAQGTYDIEAGMFERAGGAFLAVRGAKSGAPFLPVLAKNGAGPITVPQGGIGLTDDPVTQGPGAPAGEIGTIQVTSTNVVVGFKPTDPAATYRLARSIDLVTWTVLPDAPVVVGANLVFTALRGAEPAVYYHVVQQ